MDHFNDAAAGAATLLLASFLLVAGCSSSSDSSALTEHNSEESVESVPDPTVQIRTQVDFSITVPAYQSNALQVLSN